jgi:hypothetical protein
MNEAIEINCRCGWSVKVPVTFLVSTAGTIAQQTYKEHRCVPAPTEAEIKHGSYTCTPTIVASRTTPVAASTEEDV